MSMTKVVDYKLGSLNINYLIKKYGKFYIKKGDDDDYIFETSLYWKFRDFVFKNVMIPNKIQADIGKLNKKAVSLLFSYYIFKKLPITISLFGKSGWVGWKLEDAGYGLNYEEKEKREKRHIYPRLPRINLNKLFDKFLLNNVIKDGRGKLKSEEMWDKFKDWWYIETERDYPPPKQRFMNYVQFRYLKKGPNKNGEWKGYRLKKH